MPIINKAEIKSVILDLADNWIFPGEFNAILTSTSLVSNLKPFLSI